MSKLLDLTEKMDRLSSEIEQGAIVTELQKQQAVLLMEAVVSVLNEMFPWNKMIKTEYPIGYFGEEDE